MTKQEAFEKFIAELDFQDIAHDTESIRQLYWRAWQAAKADSASEIAELKDANLCKTHCPACGSDTANTNEAKINKLNRELQANIHVLREALEIAMINGDYMKNEKAQLEKVLASTPAQSLQAHENEVIERCAIRGRLAQLENKVVDIEIRALKGKE